jgi:hypothetical protein
MKEQSVRMRWLRTRWALGGALTILLAGALTTASLAALGGPSGSRAALAQTQPEETEAEIHGGPNARVHGGTCDVPAGAELQGNWTHGDYVTAWEKADPTKVREAAHSRCGKPAHAGGPHAAKKGAGSKAKPPRTVPPPEPQPPGQD